MIYLNLLSPALQNSDVHRADLVIQDQNSYLDAYRQIVNAIHLNKDLHVLVREKTVARWLKVLALHYGGERVSLTELSVHKQLQSQIGIEVPPTIAESQLLESGLLELNIIAAQNSDFEIFLLEVFFGNFLTTPHGLYRVVDMIASYDPAQWKAALDRPLVKEVYQKRIRQLQTEFEEAGDIGELQILNWLNVSPELLIRNLAALKFLYGYPRELGKRVLGNNYPDLLKMKLDLRKIPPILTGNEKVVDEIQVYLESISDINNIGFDTLLTQVSGYLEIEFDSLFRFITSGNFPITNEVIRKIQEKFSPLTNSPRLSQALMDLNLLITKYPPPKPDKSWQAHEWIDWAVGHYLPYRFWLENSGQINDDIGEIASEYSDWLYENYGQLLYNSENMAWKSILNLKELLKSHDGPALIVVIDNLNAKFYPDLQNQMQKHGYYEHSLSYSFSMLPSCTEVSKKCLLTGHYAPFSEGGYQNQVEATWTGRLGRKVKYLGGIGDFRLIQKREFDVYFLNYLPLDITLHQSENQTGLSHSQAIRSYLASLIQDIHSFSRRIGAERNLLVVITSDHGSTRIPKGIVNVIQGKFYRERAVDEHHRYISVSDDELTKLPQNSQYDCYLFNRNIYGLTTNYLAARRLYRFLPTDENVYIHGGLTPEETLVPIAIYYPITVTPKSLAISVVGSAKLYIGTKLDITLEITNFNAYPCEDVAIEFPDTNIETKKLQVGNIQKLQRVTATLLGRCPRTADPASKKLLLLVTYRFLGQPWENQVEMPIEIIEPAKTKFEMDNL